MTALSFLSGATLGLAVAAGLALLPTVRRILLMDRLANRGAARRGLPPVRPLVLGAIGVLLTLAAAWLAHLQWDDAFQKALAAPFRILAGEASDLVKAWRTAKRSLGHKDEAIAASAASAVGQVAGAFFTAAAALLALVTAVLAVRATRRQTLATVLHQVLTAYASPGMYEALQGFGRYVGSTRKGQFDLIATRLKPHFARDAYLGLSVDWESREGQALRTVLADLGYPEGARRHLGPDAKLNDVQAKRLLQHRRQIHHHFKMIWALHRAGLVRRRDLAILTRAHVGYELWRSSVLPLEAGIAWQQHIRGRPNSFHETWPWQLMRLADRAPNPARARLSE